MKKLTLINLIAAFCCTATFAADNRLTESEEQDGWILLFNGKDFDGWQIDKWNPESFSVEDGAIKCRADMPNEGENGYGALSGSTSGRPRPSGIDWFVTRSSRTVRYN